LNNWFFAVLVRLRMKQEQEQRMTSAYHKTSREWVEEGDTLSNNGHYEQALNAYENAIALDKNNAYAYGAKGYVLNKLKWHGEAITACHRALDLGLHQDWVYTNQGWALMDGFSRFEDAMLDFNKAIQINPGYAWAYYNKGVVFSRTRRENLAVEAFDQAIKLNPREPLFYTARNDAFAAADDARRATAAMALQQTISDPLNDTLRGLDFFSSFF
jgi:tetratricopeptide (TPR) repeat protein